MRKLFIFDLDDTLMLNYHLYNQATIDFLQYLMKVFKNRTPTLEYMINTISSIDIEMIKKINPASGVPYGFAMERFPDSFVAAYKKFCEDGWGKYDSIIAAIIHNIGMTAFKEESYWESGMMAGAEETLNFLKNRGDDLALLTKGDVRVQDKKIKALRLSRWFKNIRIVDDKTRVTFYSFTELRKAEYVFSVGNSFSSDIRPALDVGFRAIFIPCQTWRFENINPGRLTDSDKRRLTTLKSISELPETYKKMFD
ncbi:MAG: HAD hydrolase-like protein [Patescibacteria group bacterium]